MTVGYVALAVEGFQLCGTSIRDETRVLQSIKSTVTGQVYCFYSLGTKKDVQLQFDLWMERFVRVREDYHIANKKSSGKEQKKAKS